MCEVENLAKTCLTPFSEEIIISLYLYTMGTSHSKPDGLNNKLVLICSQASLRFEKKKKHGQINPEPSHGSCQKRLCILMQSGYSRLSFFSPPPLKCFSLGFVGSCNQIKGGKRSEMISLGFLFP